MGRGRDRVWKFRNGGRGGGYRGDEVRCTGLEFMGIGDVGRRGVEREREAFERKI